MYPNSIDGYSLGLYMYKNQNSLGAAHLISRGGGGFVFYWESDNFFVFI